MEALWLNLLSIKSSLAYFFCNYKTLIPITFHNIKMRAVYIMCFSDLHGVRGILGLAEFLWAITLLIPGDTFGRPTYHVMSQVMSEEYWGLLFLVSSFTQYYIVFKGGYHSKFSIGFAFWNTIFWCFVCLSMYFSVYPIPAAISGETALAVAAGWVFARSGFLLYGRRASDHGRRG